VFATNALKRILGSLLLKSRVCFSYKPAIKNTNTQIAASSEKAVKCSEKRSSEGTSKCLRNNANQTETSNIIASPKKSIAGCFLVVTCIVKSPPIIAETF
jgi:hypothetical protein